MLVTHPGLHSVNLWWTNLATRQAVDFFVVVGVPDNGRVFKSWANHGVWTVITQISPDKS